MTEHGGAAPTSAQRWASEAHRRIEARGRDGLATILSEDFVQESRRGLGFRFDRQSVLGTVRSMRDLGMHISGAPVAVAGDRCLLTRRAYAHGATVVELLAVSVWNEDGTLRRLVEFDVDDLDEALATLGEVSGNEPVRMVTSPADQL